MILLAIDPGNKESGYVVVDVYEGKIHVTDKEQPCIEVHLKEKKDSPKEVTSE